MTRRTGKIEGRKTGGKLIGLAILLCVLLTFGLVLFFKFPTIQSDAASFSEQYCLRDDYYIGLTDQADFGNCWAFANIKSLENILAQSTGEHFELNESHVAMTRIVRPEEVDYDYSEALIGAGGSVQDFVNAINNNGFTLDSDFGYQDFYFVNNDNQKYLIDYLNSFADNYTVNIDAKNGVISDYYENNCNNNIKRYLIQNGNASINISNWALKRKSNGTYEIVKGTAGAHALCVIGWDDNYVTESGKGAYIILNSYGLLDERGNYANEGVIYLPYTTSLDYKNCTAFSYKVQIPDDYVTLSSNANFTINTKGKYYTSTGFTGSQTTVRDKNIFDVDDEFELDYSFPQKTDLSYDLNIYRGSQNVSDDFYILKDDTHCYVYRKNHIESGSYKVAIDYSYMQNGKKQERSILKQLFFLDGLEYNVISTINDEAYCYTPVSVDSLALTDNNIYIPQYGITGMNFELRLAMSPFSDLTEIVLTEKGVVIANLKNINTKSIISIKIPTTYLYEADNQLTLTLKNQKHEKSYIVHVNYDRGTFSGSTGINEKLTTYLNVDLDGGEIEGNFPSRIALSQNQPLDTYRLDKYIPQKEGYVFAGYQYLTILPQRDNLPADAWKNVATLNTGVANFENSKQYYVTMSNVLHSNSNNYFTYSYRSFNYKNVLFVRAVYQPDENKIVLAGQGDTFDFGQPVSATFEGQNASDISWLLDGEKVGEGREISLDNLMPGNYVLTAKYKQDGMIYQKKSQFYVKNQVFNVSFDKTYFEYNGTAQKPNVTIDGLDQKYYSIEIPESTKPGQYKVEITTTGTNIRLSQKEIVYTIAKRELIVKFNSLLIEEKNGIIGPITYSVQNLVDGDMLDIVLDTSGIDTNWPGDYKVGYHITYLKDCYDLKVEEEPYVFVKFEFNADEIGLSTLTAERNKSQSFAYGQRFVINFDCPDAMLKSVQYTLAGKTYTIKQQFVTDILPIGHYVVMGKAELINGEKIERAVAIDIVKAKITIVLDDKTSKLGQAKKALTYQIVSDYGNYSPPNLVITPYIQDFDAQKAGDYDILARVDGETDNYIINIKKGTYTVQKELNKTWIVISIIIVVLLLLTVIAIVRSKIRKKKIDKFGNA